MKRGATPISWVGAAQKAFLRFPTGARERMLQALDLAAVGQKANITKPLKGLGSGVFEIALRYRSDAFRVVYGVQLAEAIWVIHAFQKKAKRGIATPMEEIELIRQRLRRLREQLR
jgi:phage-related protein